MLPDVKFGSVGVISICMVFSGQGEQAQPFEVCSRETVF